MLVDTTWTMTTTHKFPTQYDLLELRDAHAKLRTTNEKLRRDKDRSVDDVRVQVKLFWELLIAVFYLT